VSFGGGGGGGDRLVVVVKETKKYRLHSGSGRLLYKKFSFSLTGNLKHQFRKTSQ